MSKFISRAIAFDTFGSPSRVLKVERFERITTVEQPLLLKFKYSPVNPSDINQIQGIYPIRPNIPSAVAGNEGCAQVVAIHSGDSNHFKVGDWVFPSTPCLGTWQIFATARPDQVWKKPDGISELECSMMSVNVFSAYRMLKDFNVTNGQAVIQNGANSAVGRAVIQIAKTRNIETINIVRKRSTIDETERLVEELKQLGANHVIFDEDLDKIDVVRRIKQEYGDRLGLGLNCVGGKSALNLSKLISTGGTVVTYGAMSREPMPLPASLLIFKDLSFRGFWMGRWKEDVRNKIEYEEMVKEVGQMFADKSISIPNVDFARISDEMSDKEMLEAALNTLQQSQLPFGGSKKVFYFDQ